MDTAWIALIGTLAGGAGLKVVEKVLSSGAEKTDTASKLREELRKDQTELKEELRRVDHELDQWKEKYFLLLQEYLEVKSQVAHEPEKPPDPNDW